MLTFILQNKNRNGNKRVRVIRTGLSFAIFLIIVSRYSGSLLIGLLLCVKKCGLLRANNRSARQPKLLSLTRLQKNKKQQSKHIKM